MEYTYTTNYEAMGETAAQWVAKEILLKPDLVLGLATGSTPISMYNSLSKMVEKGLLTFKNTRTFNLDEYVGLDPHHSQSYAYFMHQNFWDKIDIPIEATDIPQGLAQDLEQECDRYEANIASVGGIDLQVLGIGPNGHIGFNEPAQDLEGRMLTHVANLTEDTIRANSRFFEEPGLVPQRAITMGIGTIMRARKILLLVNGEAKREILEKALFGPVTPEVPASLLQLHPNLHVISDIKL